MAKFVEKFLKIDRIEDLVAKIFQKFDTEKKGFLEKRETL
jgi:hypothetical protein